MKKTVLAVPVALLAAAALAGCAGGTAASSSSSSRPSAGKSDLAIVATTTQVADFTRNVVGDLAQVTQLIQPNASAHSFDPTAAELLAISQADVIVESGAGLETWLSKVTEAAGFKGTLVDLRRVSSWAAMVTTTTTTGTTLITRTTTMTLITRMRMGTRKTNPDKRRAKTLTSGWTPPTRSSW